MFTKEVLEEMIKSAEFKIQHYQKGVLEAQITFEFNSTDYNQRQIRIKSELLAENLNLKAKLEAILNHTEKTIDITPEVAHKEVVGFLNAY